MSIIKNNTFKFHLVFVHFLTHKKENEKCFHFGLINFPKFFFTTIVQQHKTLRWVYTLKTECHLTPFLSLYQHDLSITMWQIGSACPILFFERQSWCNQKYLFVAVDVVVTSSQKGKGRWEKEGYWDFLLLLVILFQQNARDYGFAQHNRY